MSAPETPGKIQRQRYKALFYVDSSMDAVRLERKIEQDQQDRAPERTACRQRLAEHDLIRPGLNLQAGFLEAMVEQGHVPLPGMGQQGLHGLPLTSRSTRTTSCQHVQARSDIVGMFSSRPEGLWKYQTHQAGRLLPVAVTSTP